MSVPSDAIGIAIEAQIVEWHFTELKWHFFEIKCHFTVVKCHSSSAMVHTRGAEQLQ